MALKIIFIIAFTALGMMGGQKIKALRRYAAPVLGASADRKKWWLYAWLIGVFSLGYGESSSLSKFLPKDWQRRAFVGLLVSVPFLVLKLWYAPFLTITAYLIHAGSFKVWKYDWLWEDFIRYGTIAILITLTWR